MVRFTSLVGGVSIAATPRGDAAAIGFADDFIYQRVSLPPVKRVVRMSPLLREAAQATFKAWASKSNKVRY